MKEESEIRRRRSMRLKDYDYSREGMYFVTVVTHQRTELFGQLDNGQVKLNDFGHLVLLEWEQTAKMRPNIELDQMVIMPNHIHGIIAIIEAKGVCQYAPTKRRSPSQTIGSIIRGFKSTTTSRINKLRNSPGQMVWQRNYYDHIIRNEDDLNEGRRYILNNPFKWHLDKENPANL
ncbi:conserved hypothetical protein [Candidatus Zixiibacteriota bacterium]|nr:conserved hypothetical protein [candidate division Zixibacteria bacterium]